MRSIWHLLGADSPEEGLHVATSNERLDEMRILIAQGVDINARIPTIMSGQSSGTALHIAAGYGLAQPAELLVSLGAALNVLDGMELTPLMCACSCGGPNGSRVAMLLLTAGADATVVRQSDEMTALKFAASECEPEVIQALIDKGAEVDGPANTDQTALMLAARSNNLGAIQVLIRNGADPRRPCRLQWAMGRTAAWLAQNEGSAEAYEFLKGT
jgi:ankyrin repeat protein